VNPRIRRLHADYQQMVAVFSQHPNIRIVGAEGNPPEKYAIQFNCLGLVLGEEETPGYRRMHRAEIFLTRDYPRRPPLCRMTTPVFHPNIDPQKICIGDHWSAGQRLPQLVVRIAEMIAYQSYNVKSPLNAKAAAWAEEHLEQLPLERSDFTVGL
jgi:ubiquitin-protein ligase